MSKVCEKCGRGTVSGQTKSHSNIKTKRMVKVNIQSKVIDDIRKKICTRCIKSLTKKTK